MTFTFKIEPNRTANTPNLYEDTILSYSPYAFTLFLFLFLFQKKKEEKCCPKRGHKMILQISLFISFTRTI